MFDCVSKNENILHITSVLEALFPPKVKTINGIRFYNSDVFLSCLCYLHDHFLFKNSSK